MIFFHIFSKAANREILPPPRQLPPPLALPFDLAKLQKVPTNEGVGTMDAYLQLQK